MTIPPDLDREIRAVCSPVGLAGWCTPEKGLDIAAHVLEFRPQVCVEIGIYGGRSLLAASFALQTLRSGMAYGIDPWSVKCALEGMDAHDSDDMKNIDWWTHKANLRTVQMRLADEIEARKLYDYCTLMQGRAELIFGRFQTGEIDFLHIDGNHTQLVSCRDVDLWLPRVKSGGIVFFDDTDWQSTTTAQSMMLRTSDEVADRKTYKIYRKR